MGVTEKCPGTQCCIDEKGVFGGCYDPAKCESCINGKVIQNDPDKLNIYCKKCQTELDRTDDGEIFPKLIDLCQSWEGCCYGYCYDPGCQSCNHATKAVEYDCVKSNKICCEKDGGAGECYDPKECKTCINEEIKTLDCNITSGNGMIITNACCKGTCYNSNCQNCNSSTGAITDKDGYDRKKCVQCDPNTGNLTDLLTQQEKDECKECDENGNISTKCRSISHGDATQCCQGKCFDSACKACVNGEVQNRTDVCSNGETCCGGECISSSQTECEYCSTDDGGFETKKHNKCENRTDEKTACCNGECYNSTCNDCINGNIVIKPNTNNNNSCCKGKRLSFFERCCSVDSIETTYDTRLQDCCPTEGIYNKNLQGCCPYGSSGSNYSIYDKADHACCETATEDYKVYYKSKNICCGNQIISDYKYGCCSDGPEGQEEYPFKINCEECNDGTPKKLYDAPCGECKDTDSITADRLVTNKCADRTDGKISCCDASGECYNPESVCERCEENTSNSITNSAGGLKSVCDKSTETCCDGTDKDGKLIYDCCTEQEGCCNGVCYDKSSTSCEACINGVVVPNKCINQAESSLWTAEKYATKCCGGQCIDIKCQECDETTSPHTPKSKCPPSNYPYKDECAPGVGCYDNCETYRSIGETDFGKYGRAIIRIINKPDCDCCRPENGPPICCNTKTERCCSITKQCVPKNYVNCGTDCVSPDLCCGDEIVASKSECCGGQKIAPGVECCNNTLIDSTQQCCKFPNSSTEYAIAAEKICCQSEPNGCDPGKECCYEQGSVGGGCWSASDCQECKNGVVTTTLASHEECCDGIPYSPRECETCVNNQKRPFTPPSPDCECYEQKTVCCKVFLARHVAGEQTPFVINCSAPAIMPVIITIPSQYNPPFLVNIKGSVDDDLLLNGQSITDELNYDPGPYPSASPSCVGGHIIGSKPGPYQDNIHGGITIPVGTRTFTLAVRDTIGVFAGVDIEVSLIPCIPED